MVEEAVTIEWDSNHARSQDRSVDSQNERAHMSILTSVVRVIQSLPPLAPFKPWQIEIVLTAVCMYSIACTIVYIIHYTTCIYYCRCYYTCIRCRCSLERTSCKQVTHNDAASYLYRGHHKSTVPRCTWPSTATTDNTGCGLMFMLVITTREQICRVGTNRFQSRVERLVFCWHSG